MTDFVLAELLVVKILSRIQLHVLFPNYAHGLFYSCSVNAYGDLHAI